MSKHTFLLVSPCPEVAERIQAAVAPLNTRLVRVSEAREALKCLTPAALVLVDHDRDRRDLGQGHLVEPGQAQRNHGPHQRVD